MSAKYYRPAAWHRTAIEILNSRFITTIDCAKTPESARAFVVKVRAEMPDASHHVYGFRAGYGNSVIEGMSDDGEPSGTAGPPTLAVLRGSKIGDIVLVTTRYFGGTKLGTGGLVRAYTESAQVALESLPKAYKAPKVQLGIEISYSAYESVKRLLHDYSAIINDEDFAGAITLIITLLEEQQVDFTAELTDLTLGKVEPILLANLED